MSSFSSKLLVTVVVAAAVIGSTIRLTMKSNSSGLRVNHRRAQWFASNEFTNSATGGSEVFVFSPTNTASTATGLGYGASQSFGSSSIFNYTNDIAGSSEAAGTVTGSAVYGQFGGISASEGYSTGFGGLLATPASTITVGGNSTGTSALKKGGKGKSKSSEPTPSPPTTVTTPASISGFTSGAAGGLSIGQLAATSSNPRSIVTGGTAGAFEAASVGETTFPGLGSSSGGTQAIGGQTGEGYAVGGSFELANIGSGLGTFFSALGNRFV